MANNNSQQRLWAFDSRSLPQWVVTYAAVVWFLLEVLDFLVGTYGGSSSIVKTATTFGITSFTIMLTVYWFTARGDHNLTSLAANGALFASLLIVVTSTLRTAAPQLEWLWTIAISSGVSAVITAAIAVVIRNRPVDGQDNATTTSQPNSIAVLPFRSLSSNQEDSFFAEGLSEEILNSLARIPDLQVASRNASFSIQGADAKDKAEQLDVSYLLEGSVRKSGEKLRVSVQLTQAAEGYAVWAKTYNSVLDDIFEVQDQIAERVADALKSTLWETVIGDQAKRRTTNTEAYREYLLAMHYDRIMHQGGTAELELVREHAERAVALDPKFVPAWIILADVYLNRMGYTMPREEAHGLARDALNNALNLDPDNPEVILQLAELVRGEQEYSEALWLYRRARELDTKSPHVDYATLLYTVGNLENAIKEFEHCIDMDPENFSLWYYYASALLSKGKTKSALENYEKSLEIAGDGFLSDGVRATLAGITYLYQDQARGAEILEPCLKHNPHRIDFEHGLIAGIQGLMGDKATAETVAAELEQRAESEHIDPQALFWVHYGIDAPDRERIFHWMAKMIEEDSFPSIYFLKTWPPLDDLRSDERYTKLLDEAGLNDVS